FGVPPKNAGDYGFVQHMISTLNHEGKAGVVMPHGVLFRGGAEGKIRQGILDDDLLEAVIGLPANLFYGTGIRACILDINQNKATEQKSKTIILEGFKNYQETINKNILSEEDISNIVKAYND